MEVTYNATRDARTSHGDSAHVLRRNIEQMYGDSEFVVGQVPLGLGGIGRHDE